MTWTPSWSCWPPVERRWGNKQAPRPEEGTRWHAKAVNRFGEETRVVDYAGVRQIIEAAGYRDYLAVEYEEQEYPPVTAPRFVEQLKRVVL